MTAKNKDDLLWRDALSAWAGDDALFNDDFLQVYGGRRWAVDEADSAAAHSLHVELISRITTQPLGYTEGVEEAALHSVFSLFAVARTLTRSARTAHTFETVVWHVLNTFVRPFTAKWHQKAKAGLLRGLDTSDVFRAELRLLQGELIAFDRVLARIADGEWYLVGRTSDPADAAIRDEMTERVTWRPMGEPSAVASTQSRSDEETARLERLRSEEEAYVRCRRKFYSVDHREWASGLALSGGGIRSATFAMGVMVSLAKRNMLPQFDYLSTVSGGGYTGSFLTQLLGSPDRPGSVSLRPTDLPFRREEGESFLLQRIRHGASFLAAGAWERFGVAMAQAQGIFISFLFLVLMIGVMTDVLLAVNQLLSARAVAHLPVLFAIGFFVWALILPVGRRLAPKILNRLNAWVCATLLIPPLWLGVKAAGSAADAIRDWLAPDANTFAGYAIVFMTTFAAILSVTCGLYARFNRGRPLLMSVLTVIFLVLAQGLALQVINELEGEAFAYAVTLPLVTSAFLALTLNVNTTSLHHYYRKKLSQAFIINPDNKVARPMKLSEFSGERAIFPIINCSLNVPGSQLAEMRGRQADLFSFTPVAAGATAIGHFPTFEWEKANPKLDLATTMALSGAAVSPQMGLKTIRYGSFWLTLLNLRLNLWLKKPRQACFPFFPTLWNLAEELAASADEKGTFLNISDGGHIENLGVYELLRRRCKFIVAVDGENDSQMTFHALTNLQRLAYIDHGIVIEADLEDLRPSKKGLSRSHFRFCRIRYPAGPGDHKEQIGYLVYVKLSLTGNEGEFIRRYKFDEPAFPHHSTADQFFTEVQFEAYRALGEHVGDKMFLEAISGLPDSNDLKLEEWFQGLGRSFLEPLNRPKRADSAPVPAPAA